MQKSDLTKSTRSQVSNNEDEKKQKPSLMKKLLVKNKIVSILSHQPRKLMKLAKKGNQVYKNLEQHTLLPKLTLKNLFPEIEHLNIKNKQHHEHFQEVNKELTCSMIIFQDKFTKISKQQQGTILNLQTQKCYSHIPQHFFKQLTQQQIQSILTKNKSQAEERTFDLIDYSDEIEYNINQQVVYKMRVFMDFSQFLQALAGLIDISCQKIQTSRARSNIVREIIVQKSMTIKLLRVKQCNLGKCIKVMQQMKKVKHMQKSLMSLIHAKGKITVGEYYQQYINEHEKTKEFCCKKALCNFGDIRYYVQRNYQETFNKSLQDYLCQLTKVDKQKLQDILRPNKATYVSSPFDNRVLETSRGGEKPMFAFDESVEWEDEFQLTVKGNIEKEILNIFQFGLQRCTYSTDSLCATLKQQLQQVELSVYSVLLENIQRPKQDMIDNFVNFALNKPTKSSLQLSLDEKIFNKSHKFEIINRIAMVKYVQVVQLLSKKLMDLTIRCFSVINELLGIVKRLESRQPQKQEIISAYLLQILLICINSANSFLGMFINLREIKQAELQLSDKLINVIQQWQEFIEEAQVKYKYLWRKLIFHLNDQINSMKNVKTRDSKDIRSSFMELEEFVKLTYKKQSISGEQDEELDMSKNEDDISQDLITKSEIKLKLLSQLIHAKNEKLNFNFYALGRMIINKNLTKVIENESWTAITIMSSKIQNSVGYLLYGERFLHRLGKIFQQNIDSQNDSRNFLSKSLLLEKSNFGYKKKSEQSIHSIPPPPEEQFEIETNEKYIKIGERCFKIIGVTEYILEVVYLFFLYFDKYSMEEERIREQKNEKENEPERNIQPPKIRLTLLISKTTEIINILTSKIKYYVNNLKDLQKKVKSFAKFLLLIYVQLDFFKTIIASIIHEDFERRRFPVEAFQKNTQKEILELRKSSMKEIDDCMNEIIKKYNSIGYEKIKESIKKLEFNPKKQIKNPSQTTSQILAYFSKSLQIIQDIIIDKKQFWKFLNCPWIKIYLQKINDQSSQIRKFVLKSNGSNSGKRIEQIEWQDKLDWKAKELKWLLSAIENDGYTQHIKDINILEEELRKLTEQRR